MQNIQLEKGVFTIKRLLKPISFIFIILITVMSSVLVSSGEQSLRITKWLVESTILENGDLKIEEDIVFNFKGKYNGIFRDVVLEGSSGIDQIRIAEVSQNRILEYEEVKQAKKGDKNVFLIDEKNDNVKLQVFSPSQNEEKTFRIMYTIKNVAKKYKDIGEVYYKFLGKENDTPIDVFVVNIILPQKDINNQVKIFAHGPLNGEINKTADDTVNLQVKNVPRNTYVEGRVLFPKQFIASSKNIINKDGFSSIMSEEARLQEKLEKDARKKESMKILLGKLATILAAIQLIIFTLFFIKYRRPKYIYQEEKYLEVPDDNTPAVIGYITSIGIGNNIITATILDLYRKGYIEIDQGQEFKRKKEILRDFTIRKVKPEDDNLLNHEKHFINWLINLIGDGSAVRTQDIENYSKANVSKFAKQYNEWVEIIKKDADQKGYFDKSTKKQGILLTVLFPIGLILSIVTLVSENISGLFLIFTSILMVFQGISLLFRRSDYGYYQYKKWTEFRKHMKKIKQEDQTHNLDRYPRDISLIYGLAFGVDNTILNKLNIGVNRTDRTYSYGQGWMYWYFVLNSGSSNAFGKSINNSFGASTSSVGGGGGFTAGGGGGAGGGGAGGF